MTTQQPEALRLANELDAEFAQGRISNHTGRKAATELRRQHARIAELEAQLESIGAGGVSGPLMGQPQAPLGGRWYMVTHDGAATLCIDQEDAQAEAVKADRKWPHMGPHRAVQLVEVASVAVSAESEPVARQSIETAPKDGTRILLHPAVEVHDAWSKGYWSEQHKCWIVGGSASGVTHTHWMHLPLPPTTSAGSGKGG